MHILYEREYKLTYFNLERGQKIQETRTLDDYMFDIHISHSCRVSHDIFFPDRPHRTTQAISDHPVAHIVCYKEVSGMVEAETFQSDPSELVTAMNLVMAQLCLYFSQGNFGFNLFQTYLNESFGYTIPEQQAIQRQIKTDAMFATCITKKVDASLFQTIPIAPPSQVRTELKTVFALLSRASNISDSMAVFLTLITAFEVLVGWK